MSLKSKIEAVIYASEEPVTLAQLVVLLSEEAQSELDAFAAQQAELPLDSAGTAPQLLVAPIDESTQSGEDETPSLAVENSVADAGNPDTDATTIPMAASAKVAESTFAIDMPEQGATSASDSDRQQSRERERAVRDYLRSIVDTLIRDYTNSDRGLEIREVAGGFRFGTKPEYHDAVRGFVKSLKPALKLSLQALETLAVVAYKQPVTAAEISEIRGVDSAGVLGGLLTRKLIQTAGRKQVIGRPMLYKTTKEFLVRFGLRDVQELPSMEEFERMAGELAEQEDLPMDATDNVIERANARGDAEHIREANEVDSSGDETASPAEEAGQAPESTGQPEAGEDRSSNATAASNRGEAAASSPQSEARPAGTEQEPA